MIYRDVINIFGDRFKVPEHIQRLDHKRTHAWQLRITVSGLALLHCKLHIYTRFH